MNPRSVQPPMDESTTSPFTSVPLSECFPLDQPPASSTDTVSFSHHNVLQVCSRWIVYLYLSNSLNAPNVEIVPRQHPLCHFSEKDSLEFVLGAKWSQTLVPEVRYPAESRLCVITTSSLIVYRVTRHGDTRIEVSHGIGIATPCMHDGVQGRQRDAPRSQPTVPIETSPSKQRQNPPSGAKTRATAKGRAGAKRRRPSSSTESSEDSFTSSSSSSSSSTSSASSSRHSSPTRSEAVVATTQPGKSQECRRRTTSDTLSATDPVIIDVAWLPGDWLVVLSTEGLHVIAFEDAFSDETEAVVQCLGPPSHAFAEDALGTRLAPPSCLTVVQSSPLLRLTSGAGSGGPQTSWASRLIIVTSPFVSRVFLAEGNRVMFLHYIETPLISAVPSCNCALLEAAATRFPTQTASAADECVEVTLLIASPVNTICGTFTVSKTISQMPSPSLFTLRHVYAFPADSTADPFIRGFHVVPVTSVPTTEPATVSGKDPQSPATCSSAPFLVFAVAHRAYYGLQLSNPAMTTLFRCVSLVADDSLPPECAIGVCGIAVHSSTALAVALLHTGYVQFPPLHVLPLSAGDPKSPLHRQLSLTGTFNGVLERHPDMEQRSAASCSNLYLEWLWQHQRDVSFFTWEPLFSLSTACTALRSYVDGWRYLTNKNTFLRELRAWQNTVHESSDGQLATAHPTCVLRDRYRRLRTKWGVELFLRWPAPVNMTLASWTANTSSHSHSDGGEGQWWWHLLLQLWRQHPWDPTALAELTLAKAVRVLALGTHYANMSPGPEEHFRQLEDPCAPTATTLSVESALCFVQLYLRKLKQFRLAENSDSADGATQFLVRTSAYTTPSVGDTDSASASDTFQGSAVPFMLPWAAVDAWDETLHAFLTQLGDLTVHAGEMTCLHTSADMTTVRFPCSVCDAPGVVSFNLTFRDRSVHSPYVGEPEATGPPLPPPPPEAHVTLFSGTTFSPLSLFCEDCVLTRCLGCGFADYATGPLCRLCAGLLL